MEKPPPSPPQKPRDANHTLNRVLSILAPVGLIWALMRLLER